MIWEMIAYLHVFLLTGLFLDTGSVSKETWASWARGTHCHLALTHRSQPGHSSYPCVHPQLSPRCCVLGLELCYNGSTSVLAAVEDGGTAGDGTEHYSFGDSAILELSAPSGYFKRVIGKKHELFPQVSASSLPICTVMLVWSQFIYFCTPGTRKMAKQILNSPEGWDTDWLLKRFLLAVTCCSDKSSRREGQMPTSRKVGYAFWTEMNKGWQLPVCHSRRRVMHHLHTYEISVM